MTKFALAMVFLAACGKGGDKTGPDDKGGAPATAAEAEIQLNAIGKHAKALFVEKTRFPTGQAGPTGCKAETWSEPVWKELGFRIDEQTKFKYRYDSADGKSFTAVAEPCDGGGKSYHAEGQIQEGNPIITIE